MDTRNRQLGLKPGTNYNHSPAPGPGGEIAVLSGQLARCATGEHDVAVVPAGKVVYRPFGAGRRKTGDSYCRACQADL